MLNVLNIGYRGLGSFLSYLRTQSGSSSVAPVPLASVVPLAPVSGRPSGIRTPHEQAPVSQIIGTATTLLGSARDENKLTQDLNNIKKSIDTSFEHYANGSTNREAIRLHLNDLNSNFDEINNKHTEITNDIIYQFTRLCTMITSNYISQQNRELAKSTALVVITKILNPNLKMTLLERFITHCHATNLTDKEKTLVSKTLRKLTKKDELRRMQDLLQKIQNTQAKAGQDQAWVKSMQTNLFAAWVVRAIHSSSSSDLTDTAISLSLFQQGSKKNIELLLSHAFNKEQTLGPGDTLESTLKLISKRGGVPPIKILEDYLTRRFNDMPSTSTLEHALDTQTKRLERLEYLEKETPNPSNRDSIAYAKAIIKAISHELTRHN